MKRIGVIIGTRPEAIKMAPVILALREAKGLEPVTILTAQHREMSDEVLALFGISPDHDLDIMTHAQSLFQTTGRLITKLEEVYAKAKPDLVLVQGDTTTTFVGALAAHYLQIPIGHVEAGLRTSDKHNPFPEEMNRRLTSSLTDLHFPPTENARQALLRENVPESTITVTGNTVIDALYHVRDQLEEGIIPAGLDRSKRWVLVTSHRRENWGEPLEAVCNALLDLAARYEDVLIVYPVHPNPRVREVTDRLLKGNDRVRLLDPLDYRSFVAMMNASYLIVTDSGGVQEEAPSLGKPVLVIREKTERPEAVEAGTVKLVGTDRKKIVSEASALLDSDNAYQAMSRRHNPYGDGKACERIVRAVQDYCNE